MKNPPGVTWPTVGAPVASDNSSTGRRRRAAGLAIAANLLLSGTVLPLAMPPFRVYSAGELLEVLLWQGMGMVG